MKIMVISDTHDDTIYVREAVDTFRKEGFDKLFVLGDIGVDSISILNEVYDKVLAVKGNCDSYDEEDAALFSLPYLNFDYDFQKVFVLSHGNYYLPYNYEGKWDVFLFGHYHVSSISEDKEGRIVANPGSLGQPRDGYHSYLEIDEKGMRVKDIVSKSVLHFLDF